MVAPSSKNGVGQTMIRLNSPLASVVGQIGFSAPHNGMRLSRAAQFAASAPTAG